MSGNKIRVLIIDDSVLVRKYVSRIIEEIDSLELIGTAPNGKIGLQKILMMRPDMVILDIEMPEMSGLELLKYIKSNMAPTVRPDVIMFSSLLSEGSSEIFEALANGAADIIQKPVGQITDNIEQLKKEFELKIKELHFDRLQKSSPNNDVVRMPTLELSKMKDQLEGLLKSAATDTNAEECLFGISHLDIVIKKKLIKPEMIAVGSSTGGPNAIRKVMDNLGDLPIPMVIAQHMPKGFTSEFAKNLSLIYNRQVRELKDGEALKNGEIYICPGGCHSQIVKVNGTLLYREDNGYYEGFFFKPSVDIFFRSVFDAVGKNVVGVILSGMGKDGSIESVKMRRSGCLMLAQDENSSVVWGMPGSSVKRGGIDIVVNIADMGSALNTIVKKLC